MVRFRSRAICTSDTVDWSAALTPPQPTTPSQREAVARTGRASTRGAAPILVALVAILELDATVARAESARQPPLVPRLRSRPSP